MVWLNPMVILGRESQAVQEPMGNRNRGPGGGLSMPQLTDNRNRSFWK